MRPTLLSIATRIQPKAGRSRCLERWWHCPSGNLQARELSEALKRNRRGGTLEEVALRVNPQRPGVRLRGRAKLGKRDQDPGNIVHRAGKDRAWWKTETPGDELEGRGLVHASRRKTDAWDSRVKSWGLPTRGADLAQYLHGGSAPVPSIGCARHPSDEPPGPAPSPASLLALGPRCPRHSEGSWPSPARCTVRWPIARAGPPAAGSGRTMGPQSPPPTRWLCVLAGALACALGPTGGRATRMHQECDYLQMIEMQRRQCLEEAQLENETAGCSKMWDNLTCWPATPRGQVVVLACPPIFTLFSPIQGRNVSRSCTDEGWTHLEPGPYPVACGLNDKASSLDEQQQTVFFSSVKTGYTIGYSLSLAALLVATAILSLFRKLHCTRNYIHMHLFISFILRAAAVFIKDLALFDSGESDQCSEGSVGCKVAVVFFQYCVMANFFWLLVEGLYLHTLLAVSFFSERKYFWGYILIGWGVPSTFTMVWTVIRIQFEDYGCWDTINSPLWWIIKGPILASILVNFVLFICIIRILVQKLRPPDIGKSDSSPYSRLAKSTLLLIPLFGVHYIMFAFFPDNFKAEVKLVFELVVGSFQGFVVAVLYCFLNGEVQAELRRKWRRWHLQGVLGWHPKYQHPSVGSNGATSSTQVSMLTRVSPSARRASSFQAEVSLV